VGEVVRGLSGAAGFPAACALAAQKRFDEAQHD